jgi:hypothetical protein
MIEFIVVGLVRLLIHKLFRVSNAIAHKATFDPFLSRLRAILFGITRVRLLLSRRIEFKCKAQFRVE